MSANGTSSALSPRPAAPVLALSIEGACAALGVSWDTWRASIESDVKIVRIGRRKLVPVSELQAWLDRHAERPLGDAVDGNGRP